MGAPLRHCLLVAAALSLGCGVAAADPGYVANVIPCEQRTLVLSAFPAEADAVLAHTALDANPVVVADRRRYYLGSISGKKVIVAMTGIGLVNATNTTETAFARFMNHLGRQPQLFVGGDGSSSDKNNGQAFPCIPNGGSVFGCQPCSAPDRSLGYTGNFFQAAGPWLKNALISNLNIVSTVNPGFDAVDQETAAAQAVADAHGVPFLGIRGMSDGPGDPLHLPGFPVQFFVYKQIAANNAARVTEAFLQNWAGV